MSNSLSFILKLQDLLSPGMRAAASVSGSATSSIRSSLKNVEIGARGANNGINGLKSGLGGLLAMAAPLVGAFASFEFFKGSIEQYNEQAQATASLEASLVSTKGAAGLSAAALTAQADALQKTTLYGDEATQKMQGLLLTFTNIKGPVFTEAVPAIQDLATKMGTDLQSAAVQVGKALNDPVKGITALQRVGVSFTESQKDVIKNLVATGQTAEAQRMILKELGTEFGGSAAAAAKAGTGPFKLLQNQFGETREEIGRLLLKLGTVFMPVIQGVIDVVNGLVQGMKDLYHWFQEHQVVVGILTVVIGGILVGMAAYNAILLIHSAYGTIVTAVTAAWTFVQTGLNAAFWANPLAWVIGLVIALIAVIGYVVYATDGWGKQWDQIVKFFKSSFASFKDFFLLTWMIVQNNFMTGLEFIEKGWYKLKSLWDEEGAAAGLAKINDEQNKRAAEIATQKGKLASDVIAVSQSLTWELKGNGKGLSTMTGDLKKKLGIGGAGAGASPLSANGGGLGKTGLAGMNGGDAAAAAGKGKADAINSGGQRNITITIGKQIEKLEVHVMNAQEGVQQIEDMVREAMRRVLYSLNGTTAS